jgi:hypothetical protein
VEIKKIKDAETNEELVVCKFENGGGFICKPEDESFVTTLIGFISHKTVKDGRFFVTISESLNVSGYGDTEEDSFNSFLHNLNLYIKDTCYDKKQ